MNIKIYSTPTCYYCVKAKEFFKSKGLSYTDLDVSRDRASADEMVKKTGQMGVPVIEINGKTVVGFDKSKIERILSGSNS